MLRMVLKCSLVFPAVAVTFYDNVGYPSLVTGDSMEPTLNPDTRINDVVFINRFATRNYVVKRNDIVALINPKDSDHRIIKRVIGIEGDTIRTRSYRDSYVNIPHGHIWVEGDNMECFSLDSNVFGPVSAGLVLGRATFVIWPPSRWRRLKPNDPISRSPVIRKPMPHILSDDYD